MDGENRGDHDRAVVRALRSLEPATGPTATERQRIRDRILLALDAEDSGEPKRRADLLTADEPTELPGLAEVAASADAATEVEANQPPDPAPAPVGHADTPTAPRRGTRRRGRAEPAPSRPGQARGQVRPRQPGTTPEGKPERKLEATPEAARRGVLAGARGRLAVAALALLALVGSLAGMSVLLARDALPGDALYGVKRTAEAASLGLTFGDEPKALKHLEFATARISEIETLARRYPNPEDAPVGGYLTALTDFDNDATAGSRQLIMLATHTDGRLLESLRDWSTQQASRLERIATRLPGDARNRQIASRVLLDRITKRTGALLARMNCFQITSGSSDDIGALPATAACEERDPAPASSTSPTSVAPTTDNSAPTPAPGAETPSPPVPSSAPTPVVPPVPVPGATVSVPVPTPGVTVPPVTTTTPPLIDLSPLLPGLGLG